MSQRGRRITVFSVNGCLYEDSTQKLGGATEAKKEGSSQVNGSHCVIQDDIGLKK